MRNSPYVHCLPWNSQICLSYTILGYSEDFYRSFIPRWPCISSIFLFTFTQQSFLCFTRSTNFYVTSHSSQSQKPNLWFHAVNSRRKSLISFGTNPKHSTSITMYRVSKEFPAQFFWGAFLKAPPFFFGERKSNEPSCVRGFFSFIICVLPPPLQFKGCTISSLLLEYFLLFTGHGEVFVEMEGGRSTYKVPRKIYLESRAIHRFGGFDIEKAVRLGYYGGNL